MQSQGNGHTLELCILWTAVHNREPLSWSLPSHTTPHSTALYSVHMYIICVMSQQKFQTKKDFMSAIEDYGQSNETAVKFDTP